MDYVKTIIRSILVSNPEKCTISQLLKDYVALEGQHLPYKQLGFNNVFEVLQNMKDVVKLPQHLSMDSTVTLVVDEKILHLRQLVVNQKKNKKRRTRNYYSDVNLNSGLRNSYGYNENNLNSYNAPRGYDYTKKLPVRSSRNKGFVTNQLQSSIENLCRNSQSTSLRVLKNCLITHPDYKLLNSNNIEEAINMLKYFIYIDKSGVHLKNCSSEIFPTKPSKLCNNIRPNFENFVKDVINEVEILDDDIEEDWFSTNEYYENLDNQQFNYDNTLVTKQKKENSCKMPEKAVDNQESKYNNNVVNQQKQENSCKIPERTVDNQESKYNNNVVTQQIKENSCKMFERAVDNQQSKYDNTVVNQQKQENSCEMPKVANNLSILAVQPKTQFKVNEDHALLAKDLDKCKNALTSIIASYKTPVTVDEVLKIFKKKYGYCFPIQNFSCRTVMDFFRLYPALFLLDDPYSSNSIIRLGKQPKPKRTIRHNFISASKFMYENEGYYENNNLTKYENASELVTNNITHQETNENDDNMHFSESSDIEIQDSHMILDSMKKKISLLLSKHKDGISCNTFMDVYGKEYNTYFTYSEYGFNSMRDMAYNLPSVFYVKVTEIGDCILYNASRRIELKKDCYDPSQYYKKIPKSIMHNLSSLFDNYRSGILFQELKQLYCSKFGRSYEPFKYGYTSERHMFESLNKMVKIENDIVYTLNPYAYIPFENNENSVNKSDKTLPVLPMDDYLLNYSGNDICSGKFVYSEFLLSKKRIQSVVVAEIYNPSSFYLQISQSIENLNNFMDSLQLFYDNNGDKYKVLPELIIPGLACAACFEESQRWHRAIVMNVIDEHNVKLLYVDYGSIEVTSKSKVRLLEKRYGVLPVQALHCSLFQTIETIKYPREINEKFAMMIDNRILEAEFHDLITEDTIPKRIVTLYVKQANYKIDIKSECSKEMLSFKNGNGESIRRLICKVIGDSTDDEYYAEIDEH